ncbi:Grap2 and cyclin-D-interacting-domain-containing protein [Dissophora ornata]|nr:Grap2 and cyclin-D-interacting-domain-containing protein [Dissophora ornata]
MTEEAQQKIRSLVEMAMGYVVKPQPLLVPAIPETLDALVEQLNNNLSLNGSTTTASQNPQEQQDEETWDGESFGVRLAGLGKLLSNDVTKATLACKPPAETKTVVGMIDALAETCFRLAGFVESIPVKVAGQAYKCEIQVLANNIFLATAGLLNEFLVNKVEEVQIQEQTLSLKGDVHGLSKKAVESSSSVLKGETAKTEDGYLVKTGIVWEACQIFEQASRSNRQAVAKKLGDMMSTMEDAIAEVQDMIDSNDDKGGNEDEDGDGSGSESDDSWNDDEKMTEEEKQLSVRANALLKLTRMLLKKLQQRCLDTQSNVLTAAAPSSTSSSTISLKSSDLAMMCDQLYDRAGGIVALADEIATSLYSPQDQSAIVEMLQELNRKNHDCILVGRLFVRGQTEHEKWLDMCETQAKKILDTVFQK